MNIKTAFSAAAIFAVAMISQFSVAQDWAMVPSDAKLFVRVKMKELNANQTFKSIRSVVDTSDIGKAISNSPVDEKSIDKILFYTQGKEDTASVIVIGTFDNAKIKEALKAGAVNSDGFKAYEYNSDNGGKVYMALPKNGMVIGSDKIRNLKALSAVLEGKSPSLDPKSEIAKASEAQGMIVFAGVNPGLGSDSDSDPEFVRGCVTAQAPSALKAEVVAAMKSAEIAAQKAQEFSAMLTFFGMMAAQNPEAANTGLPELIQALKIKAEGKAITGSVVLTEAVVKKLAAAQKNGGEGLIPGLGGIGGDDE